MREALGALSFMAALIGACLGWIPVYGMILPAVAALLGAASLRLRVEELFVWDSAVSGLTMGVMGLVWAAVWTALALTGVIQPPV